MHLNKAKVTYDKIALQSLEQIRSSDLIWEGFPKWLFNLSKSNKNIENYVSIIRNNIANLEDVFSRKPETFNISWSEEWDENYNKYLSLFKYHNRYIEIIPFISHQEYLSISKSGLATNFFSNWSPSHFFVDCVNEETGEEKSLHFTSVEQYMMYCKAIKFKDLDTAKKIMLICNYSKDFKFEEEWKCGRVPKEWSIGQKEIKKLGREVKNFNGEFWNGSNDENSLAYKVVYEGCYNKFHQNENMKNQLLATKESILVEANATDYIWGVKMAISNPKISNPAAWIYYYKPSETIKEKRNCHNLLGRILMAIRSNL
jgi:ribA/ribD-fused uncharacterized protein